MYLSNRFQYVEIDGDKLDPQQLNYGVPQGSVPFMIKSERVPFKIKIHDQKLERATKHKYLGIVFGSKLNTKANISYLLNKLSKVTGIFYKLRRFVSKKTLL